MQKYLPGYTEKLEQPRWGVNLPHRVSEDAQGKCSEIITSVHVRTLEEGSCSICMGNTTAAPMWAVLEAVNAIFSPQQIAQTNLRNST